MFSQWKLLPLVIMRRWCISTMLTSAVITPKLYTVKYFGTKRKFQTRIGIQGDFEMWRDS